MAVYGAAKPARSVKVLQVAPTLGAHGGIEALALAIASEVADGSCRVHTIFRLRTGAVDQSLRNLISGSGVGAKVMRYPGPAFWRAMLEADVVHCHYPIPWVVFPARSMGKAVVLTVENQRQRKSRGMMTLEQRALASAQRAVFISRFVAQSWLGESGGAVAEVIPAVTRFDPVTVSSGERCGFVCVSRLIEGKGLIELVEAYRTSGLDGALHPLTIAGAGPLAVRLKTLASCCTPGSVRLAGYVPEKDKIQLFAQAKWNVAPQTIAEDQGLSPLEARLCGVPSIISDTGGLPEAAGPGALRCPPGNVEELCRALQRAAAMSDQEYRRRCEENERELAGYLKPMETYRCIYEQVVDKKVRQDA